MSMGTNSPLYRPIDQSVAAYTAGILRTDALGPHIGPLYRILTNHCKVEALLWFAVVDLIERALLGERDPEIPGGTIAPTLLLSAVRKDGRGKHQTPEMKLLHDVVVELNMAEENYEELQAYLRKYLGMHIGGRHSCSKDVVRTEDLAAFRAAVRADQLHRTTLDWTHETTQVSIRQLTLACVYPVSQQIMVERIFSRSEKCLARIERVALSACAA